MRPGLDLLDPPMRRQVLAIANGHYAQTSAEEASRNADLYFGAMNPGMGTSRLLHLLARGSYNRALAAAKTADISPANPHVRQSEVHFRKATQPSLLGSLFNSATASFVRANNALTQALAEHE